MTGARSSHKPQTRFSQTTEERRTDMTPKEVIKLAKDKEVKIVDLKLCDIHGTWQHFAIPVNELNEKIFEEGLGFDGSSIRGWRVINASDMLIVPDAV
ncbi:MAG TPA: glutamine synthetase beta-grasp domain-containing protein, partial [Opitutaceae bacterium]|nr:glutamine synthetase beta-grasp domain-containing protein [Opitutaceae bacterium]